MFIVMHCMGMPFNGSTIEKESLGGSETAAYYIAKGLAAQGHSVTLFTNHKEEGEWDGVRYIYNGEENEQTPLGKNFHFYAANTPHDVSIIQRLPQAYAFKWASKINFWWTHDLGLYRQSDMVQQSLWNIDGILTVSEYHKKQLVEVYGLDPDIVMPITNGVDVSLFSGPLVDRNVLYQLIYSSRPERGLENLVKDGGIMDQLPDYDLVVCAYENNTPQMGELYTYLYSQCEKKANIHLAGALTKKQLADEMRRSNLLVYPTTFEEVSCITAMEAMAAGLPMLSSKHAALPETCGGGAKLLKLKNGEVDIPKFVKEVKRIITHAGEWKRMNILQTHKATNYSWEQATDKLLGHIDTILDKTSPESKNNRLIHVSDYYATTVTGIGHLRSNGQDDNALTAHKASVNLECYKFAATNNFKQHYEDYYEYEKQRGVDYGPEIMQGNSRFDFVAGLVRDCNTRGRILDYGCAHGHYTISLAKMYPDRRFVGIDIEASNIEKAKAWAKSDGVKNVEFICADVISGRIEKLGPGEGFALIIIAELLEHVKNPQEIVTKLMSYSCPTGTEMVITTPYGPWEAQGYAEHYPWRAHVHHFERQDLHDIWGEFPDFNVVVIPAGGDPLADAVGSYVTTFKVSSCEQGHIDYTRKLRNIVGKPTVSLCMIARDAANTIGATIGSVIDIVDEVIVGIDAESKDNTWHIVNLLTEDNPMIRFEVLTIDSPIKTGFDAARNKTIERANGDWILWIDCDEVMIGSQNLIKYLGNNQYSGFCLKQHHFSVNPPGILKTDFPCRIFRNNIGIKFIGVVHEHPEISLNEGVGKAVLLEDVDIAHHGYDSEATRRDRFARNITLMKRDRKENPDRILGKFLWIRDLAQSIRFEMEAGVELNPTMFKRADEGIALWHELLQENTRMAKEGLEYYSSLVKLSQPRGCIDYEFTIKAQPPGRMNGQGGDVYTGTFFNKEHAKDFFNAIESDKLQHLDSHYL